MRRSEADLSGWEKAKAIPKIETQVIHRQRIHQVTGYAEVVRGAILQKIPGVEQPQI